MSWIEDPGVESFGSYNFNQLDIDQAFLNVSSEVTEKLWLYSLSANCHTCPYMRVGEANDTLASQGTVLKPSTVYPMRYRVRTSGQDKLVAYDGIDKYDYNNDYYYYLSLNKYCDIGPVSMGEFGIYNLQATTNDTTPCVFEKLREPVNIYYPILIAFIVYLVLAILCYVYKFIRNRRGSDSTSSSSSGSTESSSAINNTATAAVQPNPSSSTRLSNGRSSVMSGQMHPSCDPNGGPIVTGLAHVRPSISGSQMSIASQRSSVAATVPASEYSLYTGGSVLRGRIVDNNVTYSTGSVTMINQPQRIIQPTQAHRVSVQQQPPPVIVKEVKLDPKIEQPRQLQRQRLQSLDTFRGICITIMIFVNDGGAGYFFLEHAAWDGLYIADLVFPWFLWIMGVCIPLSIKSQRKRNTPRLKIFWKICVRSLKLIGIGLILASLYGPVDIRDLRLPGVLQRFGLCYFMCSTLVLLYMNVNFSKPGIQNKFKAAVQDVEIIWIGWVAILLFVMVHCLLTFFLVVPGCPTGYLGPGGLHENAAWSTQCIGGAAGYVDRIIFTENHIYKNPTANNFYAVGDKGKPYDPEGALGILTSFLQVWLGVQTGVTMLVYPKATSRVKRWLSWAVILGATGTLLCHGKETGGWIPLNKNLWSLSFVLITSCFALILLSFLYFIVDMKKWWSGTPFYEPGMNSILLYVGHSVAGGCLPWHWRYGRMATHAIRLLEALWGTSLWVIIAIYCQCKKFYWVL